mmetsp:Transcript_32118/g.105991  ORF Transcript_32118/g.105991 Transcript_32118/m.105991 type:complete len:498 (+) Transcript_32118:86-1579(+)
MLIHNPPARPHTIYALSYACSAGADSLHRRESRARLAICGRCCRRRHAPAQHKPAGKAQALLRRRGEALWPEAEGRRARNHRHAGDDDRGVLVPGARPHLPEAVREADDDREERPCDALGRRDDRPQHLGGDQGGAEPAPGARRDEEAAPELRRVAVQEDGPPVQADGQRQVQQHLEVASREAAGEAAGEGQAARVGGEERVRPREVGGHEHREDERRELRRRRPQLRRRRQGRPTGRGRGRTGRVGGEVHLPHQAEDERGVEGAQGGEVAELARARHEREHGREVKRLGDEGDEPALGARERLLRAERRAKREAGEAGADVDELGRLGGEVGADEGHWQGGDGGEDERRVNDEARRHGRAEAASESEHGVGASEGGEEEEGEEGVQGVVRAALPPLPLCVKRGRGERERLCPHSNPRPEICADGQHEEDRAEAQLRRPPAREVAARGQQRRAARRLRGPARPKRRRGVLRRRRGRWSGRRLGGRGRQADAGREARA